MKTSTKAIALFIGVVMALPLAALAAPSESGAAPYRVEGSNFHIIGGHGDNMQYDGDEVFESQGLAFINVDPVENTGKITAQWVDPRQEVADLVGKNAPVSVRIVATKFMPPEHPTGILSDGKNTWLTTGDPITINHFEHGSTGVGAPIVTNLFTYLGTWGPVEVYIDGVRFEKMQLHTMLTAGVRDEATDQVYNADRTGFYSPMSPDDGFVDMDEIQLHLIVMSGPMDPTNFPPLRTFWHLMFYDVDIKIQS